MRNSIVLLVNIKNNGEEFNIVLQEWEGYSAGDAFKGIAKIYSRRNNIYS